MTILLFIILLVLFLFSVPIAIALGLASMLYLVITADIPLITLPQRMFASLDSFPLMAAPFFVLAGKLMEHGGISERLVDFAKSLVGGLKGGLAHVGIVSCMFFAALSGSASATTAAIGAILIPSMVKAGYDRNFSTAIHVAGGTTGNIIPPSVPIVLFGVSASVSVSDLFIAGNIFYAFRRAILALFMPFIILGGIYGGYFTPTEASVVAVVYGFIVGAFVYRKIKWNVMREILVSSVITTSVILFIIATAGLFGMVLTRAQVPQTVAGYFMDSTLSPIVILLLINLFLLIVGTFMETIASVIILTPILLPVVTSIGMDPIHFGIVMIVNLSIGLMTPPVGVSLFIGAQVGGTKYEALVRAVIPFLLMMIVNVLIITFVPAFSIGFLPSE